MNELLTIKEVVLSTIIAVAIGIVGVSLTVWLTNRDTTAAMKRIISSRSPPTTTAETRWQEFFDRIESNRLKHIKSMFDALNER